MMRRLLSVFLWEIWMKILAMILGWQVVLKEPRVQKYIIINLQDLPYG